MYFVKYLTIGVIASLEGGFRVNDSTGEPIITGWCR